MTIQEMLQHADFIYYLEEAKYAEGLTPTLFISPAASDEILCITFKARRADIPVRPQLGEQSIFMSAKECTSWWCSKLGESLPP